MTIHNLAIQGVVSPAEIDYLRLPRDGWDAGWYRHDGAVNLMKGAIELADRVTTVSENYAREIQHPSHGFGLDAHLRWNRDKLVGIVNGIDMALFDPKRPTAHTRAHVTAPPTWPTASGPASTPSARSSASTRTRGLRSSAASRACRR